MESDNLLSQEEIEEISYFKYNGDTWPLLISNGYIDPYKKNNILELGACVGSTCIWMSKNFALHPETVIDTVDARTKIPGLDLPDDYKTLNTLKHLIAPYPNIVLHNTTTEEFLKSTTKKYDFIYVDADHSYDAVIQDAELSYNVLKSGGTMVFDDCGRGFYVAKYYWHVKVAVDKFCEEFNITHKYALNHNQLVIRKPD